MDPNKRITINMKLVQYYSFGKNPTLHIVRCNIAQSNWKPQIKVYQYSGLLYKLYYKLLIVITFMTSGCKDLEIRKLFLVPFSLNWRQNTISPNVIKAIFNVLRKHAAQSFILYLSRVLYFYTCSRSQVYKGFSFFHQMSFKHFQKFNFLQF